MQAVIDSTQNWHGDLRTHEPLARYTSWRVGGPADYLYRPLDVSDLQAYLRSLDRHVPLFWMGLGSNLLIRDGGIRGHVIYTRGRLDVLDVLEPSRIYVEAGVPCAHVARVSSEQRQVGAEFLAGIPGTMGGALEMNAGAFGGETWPLVERVLMMNRAGDLIEREAGEFTIGYRSVVKPHEEWFIGAWMRIPVGSNEAGREKIRMLLARRAETQPTNQPSGGSVFKNPPGDHAARLIEQSGLKGLRIGGAQVSEKHANFIVNDGQASAADIEHLIERVRETVWQLHGIQLETEVRMVGVPA